MLTVTFMGRAPVPSPFTVTGYSIWSYRIEASTGSELSSGKNIALGLPREVDVRNPALYPGVPQLVGITLQVDVTSSRQYVVRQITTPGTQTISFVAPSGETRHELLLATAPTGQALVPVPFLADTGTTPQILQLMPAPVAGPLVFNGRPPGDFAGTLPYASELFGVYRPLVGWFGLQNSLRVASGIADERLALLSRETFSGASARTLDDEMLAALAEQLGAAPLTGVLSPVGLVNLFRQYFFEFDTFLGPPAGHVWISPGGTVEVVESSTRRMLVERVAEQSEEISRKVEESLTEQDDVADAVKEDNANDTNLGISVTGGVSAPIYHADASASFGLHTTVKKSSEQTHKHSRTQSAKVTSEIKRNFKTTFRTVTETTDTSSRRYVVQNTTNELVNYELRRKMRKVGVQLQHIGTRLAWQVYLPRNPEKPGPGRDLGLGDLVHVVSAPDLSTIPKPEKIPVPGEKKVPFHDVIPFQQTAGGDDDNDDTYTPVPGRPDKGRFEVGPGTDNIIMFRFPYLLPDPEPGYVVNRLDTITVHGGVIELDQAFLHMDGNPDPVTNTFQIQLLLANFRGQDQIPFDAVFIYSPTQATIDAANMANAAAEDAYNKRVAELQREAYGNAVRDRLKLVSGIRTRPWQDLRSEERQTVYAGLLSKLPLFGANAHLASEATRAVFDVDEMLYYVAPDFWRPQPSEETHPGPDSVGVYPVPPPPWEATNPVVLEGQTVASWYSYTDKTNAIDPQGHHTPEWRVDYLITEETQPAPLGSSLGWLIQIDGDERRNEFLNAAWVKAVLPIRPGHELEALDWLARADVEGEANLGADYPFREGDPDDYHNKTYRDVLNLLAAELQASNTDIANTIATEEVFETGFDPLEGGFRPAAPYEVFDQWVEVLPTDQVVAVQVHYDPKTGQQL
ncbi:hypothetical protein EV384_4449 [Micromonospora kangleipakensis]|uniref:Uncharacterized protein n=1 Tax=Micromonospora kangleipakensis TaxID=1077942 RepID=A0A4V2GDH3_9ACTN|nr:hypothetical protein [Micromonospora kangleipakensis]RZU75876.1 hypothetical protein EV384_4449 [Micromonospora kangleipakensis]